MDSLKSLWGEVIQILIQTLNFIYGFVGDYGVAIILLTVVIRVAMLPLTIKQTRSMHDMQRIQPKLKEVQEKYKNDKEKMQEEMMKLYKEHQVNPLGGCLPMIVQLPVMIALFQMLRLVESFGSGTPSFLFLIPDLTASAATAVGATIMELPKAVTSGQANLVAGIPYIVLLIVVVATTYLPQKMMSKDAQQNRMMIIMSGFMAFIGWSLPAGVMLYWVTTNIFTLGQQWVMLRSKPEEGSA